MHSSSLLEIELTLYNILQFLLVENNNLFTLFNKALIVCCKNNCNAFICTVLQQRDNKVPVRFIEGCSWFISKDSVTISSLQISF